jgi:hypothetical protein
MLGNQSRRGTLMMQTIVAMALTSVTLTLATGLIHGVFNAYRQVASETASQAQIARFSQAIRNDVDVSIRAVLPNEHELAPAHGESLKAFFVELETNQNTAEGIRYSWLGEEMLREVYSGDQSVAREYFALPQMPTIRRETHPSLSNDTLLVLDIPWQKHHPRPFVMRLPLPHSPLLISHTGSAVGAEPPR